MKAEPKWKRLQRTSHLRPNPLLTRPDDLQTCRGCEETKRVIDFPLNNSCEDRLGTLCRTCCNAKGEAWRQANPEEARERLEVLQSIAAENHAAGMERAEELLQTAERIGGWTEAMIEDAREVLTYSRHFRLVNQIE